MGAREYARRTGGASSTISDKLRGAEVCTHVRTDIDFRDRWRHLAEIHAAPAWLWRTCATIYPTNSACSSRLFKGSTVENIYKLAKLAIFQTCQPVDTP